MDFISRIGTIFGFPAGPLLTLLFHPLGLEKIQNA
jgi:hypothetical protein